MVQGYHPRIPRVEGAFQRFSEQSVDLGEPATRSGRVMALEVIDTIEALADLSQACPKLIPNASFIAGSLGRRTLEQPLDDIDVYLVMSAPDVHASVGGTILPLSAHCSTGQTPLTADPRLKVGNHISGDAVVHRLAEHLAAWYPCEETGKGSKERTCFIKRGSINVDLTPVVWYSDVHGRIDQYWMPAGGGKIDWKPTNPKEDQRRLTEANQYHDGELLKVARMMKWWNRRHNMDRIKGIHLETMIIKLLEGMTLDGWANTIHYLFDKLRQEIGLSCPDPTGLGDRLDSTLNDVDRCLSEILLGMSFANVTAAQGAASRNDMDTCLQEWQAVFDLET